MSNWIPRLLIFALLAVLVGLPLAWRPRQGVSSSGGLRLVVITPHNDQIRDEIERAFSDWHRAKFGQTVEIDWRAGSGTSDIERLLLSGYRGLLKGHRLDDGIGYDVLFGGGDFFFDRLKRALPDGQGVLEKLELDGSLVREVYPQPRIADKPLYDPQGYWWGVVLSSFGIAYNKDVLADLGLGEPGTWSDLADGRLTGLIALADPSHSGSVRVTYEAIVQRYGWEKGWKTLRRICANSRYFSTSASKVLIDLAAGQAAAAMSIDFYGRYQAEVFGPQRMDYVAPADATVVTADPVALLRGTKRKELGRRFVEFLLSPQGQAVWCLRVGDPWGPRQFELRRPPVRREFYRQPLMSRMVDRQDMYAIARPLPPGTPSYFSVLPTVMQAMAIDLRDDLVAAWRAIQSETDPKVRQRMLELFDELPFTQQELAEAWARWKADPAARDADRLKWTVFFRDRYLKVSALGRGG